MTTLANKSTLACLFGFDEEFAKGKKLIVGTDEAGRGPGAGPVFAAAACFFVQPSDEVLAKLSVLNDSKKLNGKQREQLFEVLTSLPENEFAFHIQAGSVEEIEKFNILNTSLNCMKLSCFAVLKRLEGSQGASATQNPLILVDGNKKIPFKKGFNPEQLTVVKGDSKSASIAAASILAKVARDRFMDDLAKEFPQYDWAQNKGYLTAKHVEAIKKHGACKWHRAKFLRNIVEQDTQLGLFGS